MADPGINSDRIGMLREDLDDLRGTLRDELQETRRVALKWGARIVFAHVGLGTTIIAGLVIALLT